MSSCRRALQPLGLLLAAAAVAAGVDVGASAPHTAALPTTRQPPPWNYNWSRFPAAWYGANQTGFENADQIEFIGKHSFVFFGWQHMQLTCAYTDLLTVQVEQARRLKAAYPHMPTFIYLPIVDAQPYYATERCLFDLGAAATSSSRDRQRSVPPQYPPPSERFRDFLFLDAAGGLSPNTTHYKCVPQHIERECTCAQWNFFNGSARDYFIESVVRNLTQTDNQAFDGVFYDAATAFLRRDWAGTAVANVPTPTPSEDAVMEIVIDVLNRTIETSNTNGKYPMFNMHFSDMSFADGREQQIMGAIGGQGMFRFYEGTSPLSRSFIENALEERKIKLFTLLAYRFSTAEALKGEIAAFLLIRDEHYYYAAHRGSLDDGFVWHPDYDSASQPQPQSAGYLYHPRSLFLCAPLGWSCSSD